MGCTKRLNLAHSEMSLVQSTQDVGLPVRGSVQNSLPITRYSLQPCERQALSRQCNLFG